VVAAHPDDEALGCGATIIKHTRDGDVVQIVFLADGFGSREGGIHRDNSAQQASKSLGCKNPVFLGYPDNQLDTVPLLTLVKKIESIVGDFQPNIIYTHSFSDLNIDHQITHKATITACRPQPEFCVKEIYSFETLSATHWQSQSMNNAFIPNHFVDISDYLLKKKNKVLECYDKEMRVYPHARSYESIRALAMHRGATIGLAYAEAFQVERLIKTEIVSLRTANVDDMPQYYYWVNDDIVRKNSFDSKPIDWKVHQKWFDERLHSDDCFLYVAHSNNENIGQVRFDYKQDGVVSIHFLVSQKFRGRGLAKKMLLAAVNRILRDCKRLKIIEGKVKKDNELSHKIFSDLGFCIYDSNNKLTIYQKTI